MAHLAKKQMILFTNQKKQQKGGQVAESQGFQEPTQRGRTRCGIEQGVEITVPKKEPVMKEEKR